MDGAAIQSLAFKSLDLGRSQLSSLTFIDQLPSLKELIVKLGQFSEQALEDLPQELKISILDWSAISEILMYGTLWVLRTWEGARREGNNFFP